MEKEIQNKKDKEEKFTLKKLLLYSLIAIFILIVIIFLKSALTDYKN